MKLGEKVKIARKANKMTQEQLAGSKITRNMISRIENGTVNPSIETVKHLANKLSLPLSYLLSEDDDLLFYEKKEKISALYDAFASKEYAYCIKKISEFSDVDNEISYMLAVSYFELGKAALLKGSLNTAIKNMQLAEEYCNKTVFDTMHIKAVAKMYSAIALNIQSPLLEFNDAEYLDGMHTMFDDELYRYLIQDYSYSFMDACIKLHVDGKLLIKERKYKEAVALLLEAVEYAFKNNYNAFVVFGIYADLELCYKQLYDFENAYRYASKRMSMLEGFKT